MNFFSFLKSDKALLKQIRSSEKYAWSEEKICIDLTYKRVFNLV